MINTIHDTEALRSLFGGPVEIVDSGACGPDENMRIDEERAHACAQGTALPMLRVYAWQPWSVSLGKHQKESDIDAARCAERGYGIVRRPTGGRAVFHADELTYSVVVPLAEGRGPTDLYREINLRLMHGLNFLARTDSALQYQKSQADFRRHYRSPERSLPCFSSSARYELIYDGRKVVGSAQRRYGRVLLQHGSILLGTGHAELAEIARLSSPEARSAMKSALIEQTASLGEICGRHIAYREAADALLQAFMTPPA